MGKIKNKKSCVKNDDGLPVIMNVLTIANYKGGTGKTTCAINLAHEVARRGRKVLLVDLDDSANATAGVGLKPTTADPPLYAAADPSNPSLLRDLTEHSTWGFDVLPSGARLKMVEHLVGAIQASLPYERGEMLRWILRNRAADDWDMVVVDCPAQLGFMTTNGLAAATHVLVPFEVSSLDSIEGMQRVLTAVGAIRASGHAVELAGVLPVRAGRTRVNQDIIAMVAAGAMGPHLLRDTTGQPLTLREAANVATARVQGRPISDLGSSPTRQDIRDIVDAIELRLEKP